MPEPHRGPGPGRHRPPERKAPERTKVLHSSTCGPRDAHAAAPRAPDGSSSEPHARKPPERRLPERKAPAPGLQPHRVPEPEQPPHRGRSGARGRAATLLSSIVHVDAPRAADGSSPEQVDNRRPEPHKQPERRHRLPPPGWRRPSGRCRAPQQTRRHIEHRCDSFKFLLLYRYRSVYIRTNAVTGSPVPGPDGFNRKQTVAGAVT